MRRAPSAAIAWGRERCEEKRLLWSFRLGNLDRLAVDAMQLGVEPASLGWQRRLGLCGVGAVRSQFLLREVM
jgi:hypothetical protein